MFRGLVARPLLVGLLLAGGTGAAVAWANADALTADVQALVPSASPALLGPIDEHGRIGWECKPERAAGATHATAAELPQVQP